MKRFWFKTEKQKIRRRLIANLLCFLFFFFYLCEQCIHMNIEEWKIYELLLTVCEIIIQIQLKDPSNWRYF